MKPIDPVSAAPTAAESAAPPPVVAATPVDASVVATTTGAVDDPWLLLEEARAALRWAAWSGADAVAFERFATPALTMASQAAPPPPTRADAPTPAAAAPRRPNPGLALTDRQTRIATLHARIGDCERCELNRHRRHIVHGVGPLNARLLLIGAGPLADEDGAGTPFAGEDGALLDRMLAAMGLDRDRVFLTGLVRCHLHDGADPADTALQRCTPFLRTEIDTVRPEVIVLLGEAASRFLLKQPGVAAARGRWHTLLGTPTLATWGLPILRQQPRRKREVWQDLQTVMARLGLPR